GKFFPEKTGIQIPFYAQYSKSTSTPEFDPYDKDLTLKEKIDLAETNEEKDEIKEQALDVVEIKTFNFTNVRKERTDKTKNPKPWNIENFSLTYGFTETSKRNPIIESDKSTNYNGGLDYSYTSKAKYFTPFKKLSKSKYLKLITDFGINFIPNSFSFSTTLNREFQETRYRFVEEGTTNRDFFNKQFTWDRNYNLQWDLTKNLKLGFNAINRAVIDELKEVDGFGVPTPKADKRREIWENLRDFGRNKNYNQNIDIDYKVPLKNIPFLDWVKVTAKYRGEYSWAAASLNTLSLGNVIQNGQTRQLNGDIDFEGLYKKSKYLGKINKKKRKSRSNRRGGRGNKKADEADAKEKLNQNNRGGKDDKKEGKDDPPVFRTEGDDTGKGSGDGKEKNKLTKKEKKELKKKKKAERKKRKKDREPSVAERILLRPLMLVRKARISYSQVYSTVLPGFLPETSILGQSSGFDAPGWGFVMGLQPNINPNATASNPDYLINAAANGWITDDVFLNQRVQQNYKEDLSANLKIEPFTDFKLDLDINRSYTENTSLYFKDFSNDGIRNLEHRLPREMGQFTISYFNLNTLFKDSDELFNQFDVNRRIISARLGAGEHILEEGFANGYGGKHNEVLLPAFFAAYTGADAQTMEISRDYARDVLFDELPRINWRLNYSGLSKIPFFSNIFANFSVTHGYQNTMTVNGYQTNLNYSFDEPLLRDEVTGNFFSRFEIPALTINEAFAPLLGVQATMKNDMTLNLNFKKSRNLRLNLIANPELQEAKTTEYVVGFGWRIKDVIIGFLKGGNNKKKRGRRGRSGKNDKNDPGGSGPGKGNNADRGSDLNIAFDFSLRDDVTLRHDFDDGEAIPTRGTKTITFNPSVDYDINKQLNARLFFDYRRTVPKNSEGFPQTNFAGGVTIRFSLN
ncbi:MAG: cell surface protein SprA, partial [Bacteroidota bacterium]